MAACDCNNALPEGAKLRTEDELGRPCRESLHDVFGGRILRARAVTVDDRIKVTVAEASGEDGDVALDADGARLIYPGTVGRQSEEVAVQRALRRAAAAAQIRTALEHHWQGRGDAPLSVCPICGGEVPYADFSATASAAKHRLPNEVVLRTPRGFYARVRAVLLETGPDATALPFHFTVAQAVDETGDVVEGEGGQHRIVDCGVHSIHVDQAEVDWDTGKPQGSLGARLADLVLTEVLTRLEGAILSRTAYEKVAFLRPAAEPASPPPLPRAK